MVRITPKEPKEVMAGALAMAPEGVVCLDGMFHLGVVAGSGGGPGSVRRSKRAMGAIESRVLAALALQVGLLGGALPTPLGILLVLRIPRTLPRPVLTCLQGPLASLRGPPSRWGLHGSEGSRRMEGRTWCRGGQTSRSLWVLFRRVAIASTTDSGGEC